MCAEQGKSMHLQKVKHMSRRERSILESAAKPGAPRTWQVPRWLVAIVLLTSPFAWFLLFCNLDAIDRSLDLLGFSSAADALLPVVRLIREHQWQLGVIALLGGSYLQGRAIKERDTMIAKLYWQLESKAKSHRTLKRSEQ